MAPKIAVIIFPGTNCEVEALRALKRSDMNPCLVRWNEKVDYTSFDGFLIPGGFSYEDRGRSGVIASKNPLLEEIKKEANKEKPVLGICNGAQILLEAGLIPGLSKNNVEMGLAANKRVDKNGNILGTGFYNDWIYIKNTSTPKRSVFNNFDSGNIMRIPVAHADGRYTTLDKELLTVLNQNEQILFKYCNEKGEMIPEFPVNPNGSVENIAGICNAQGNVMSLMPHPERTELGQAIFDSMRDYLSKSFTINKKESFIDEREVGGQEEIKTYKHPQIEIFVDLIITDNEERTLEYAIRQMGYTNLKLRKQGYFGIQADESADLENITEELIKSGELVNLAKEIPTVKIKDKMYIYNKETGLEPTENQDKTFGAGYISFDKENIVGGNIFQAIRNHFSIKGIENIMYGKKWLLTDENNVADEVVKTNIFHNPHSMDMYKI